MKGEGGARAHGSKCTVSLQTPIMNHPGRLGKGWGLSHHGDLGLPSDLGAPMSYSTSVSLASLLCDGHPDSRRAGQS